MLTKNLHFKTERKKNAKMSYPLLIRNLPFITKRKEKGLMS
jgi:hypothetical protein